MWRHHLYLFFFLGHCTTKNKDIALKFCMRVVCISIIYSVFLDTLKLLDFIRNYFLNRVFEFWGSNRKIWEIRDSHLVERLILHRLALFDCVASKLYILAASKHLPFFDPKWQNITSLKRNFLKTFRTFFFWCFAERRQINVREGTESFASMSGDVFELSRKPGRGGAESAPSP